MQRRLAAILAADVAGYSRLMGADEAGTALALREHRAAVDPSVVGHGGRIVKTTGDGVLVEFPSIVAAVECAVALQKLMAERNADVPEDQRMLFRIGINLGDVLIEGDDILGDGVNVAARLEGIAEPGGICLSDSAYQQVRDKVSIEVTDMGEQRLKNIARPVRTYRLRVDRSPEQVRPALALPDKPSIAVLPFQNMSADPEHEYFADGVVEEIITALSRMRWLFVIARNSTFTYKGRAVDVKQVGRELGVRYVVEGSVRKAGNRVRVTAQLIDAGTNAHIWADRYERDLRDVFALQDELTEQIVTAIAPNVRTVEIKRALAKPTDSVTSYDLYLRALHAFHLQTEEGIKRAEALLHRAIELDPDYAEVLGMLTDCITTRTLNGWHESVAGGAAEAAELARRALAAGPDNSTCVASAAFVYATLVGRYDEGLELAERAIRLHPNSVFVRNRAGAVYGTNGKSDKAIAQFEAAQRMNPCDAKSSTFTFTGISGAHFFDRRFDDAIYWGRRALAVTPAANVARRNVAAALAHLGRLDEARAEIAELLKHQPNASLARSRQSRFRHEWMYELYLGGLRKAGLPD